MKMYRTDCYCINASIWKYVQYSTVQLAGRKSFQNADLIFLWIEYESETLFVMNMFT